ncbi:MAG: hypothetical protein AB1724_14805 [Thermodesulfobacteriota bacterium]
MVKSKHLLIAAVLVAAGITGFLLFYSSDETVIKKRFKSLAADFSRESPENDLLNAAKSKRIANMFAKTCRVVIPDYDVARTFSRDDVQPYVMMARSRYKDIAINFFDFFISFPGQGRAAVNVSVFVRATPVAGEPVQEIHEMVFSLEKGEEEWLFTDIESVEVLEK